MSPRRLAAGAALVAALAVGVGALLRPDEARILWWQGRAVSWSDSWGTVLTADGALLRIGYRVERVPLAVGGRTLIEAAAVGSGTWLVDAGGTVLARRPDGTLDDVGRTPFDVPTLAAGPGGVWAARSARQFTFRPEADTAAVALTLDTTLAPVGKAGVVRLPSNPFLAQLANAGHVLALADGGVVYAAFVRDEVIRYDAAGRTRWTLRRGLAHETPDPALRVARAANGKPDVQVDYAPVNLGLSLGPDGRLYVLSTPSATTAAARLDVIELDQGSLIGTTAFPTALPTIAVDGRGRISSPNPGELLPASEPARREPFAPFDLAALDTGRVRSADFAGRPLLVNIWASWCGPCREELPALDSLVRGYAGRLGFVALSDDLSPHAANRFIQGHRFGYRVGLGLGQLRQRYHFVGLPFTALLDAQGRIIRTWPGYGGAAQLAAIRSLVNGELDSMSGHTGHTVAH